MEWRLPIWVLRNLRLRRPFFPLAARRRRSYFRAMKTTILLFAAAVCFRLCPSPVVAQDENAARAAVERAAAEEQSRWVKSTVDGLIAAQAEMQRKLAAQADEIRALRASLSGIDTGSLVTRDELNRLVATVNDIERKREADRKLILDEFEQLKKNLRDDIGKLLSASPGRAPAGLAPGRDPEMPAVKPVENASAPENAAPIFNEVAAHEIKANHTFSTIAAAYNDYWRARGKRTSVDLIQKANPDVHPLKLKIGSKIMVPLVPIEP